MIKTKNLFSYLIVFSLLVIMSKSLLLILSGYLPNSLRILSSSTFFYIFLAFLMMIYLMILFVEGVYISVKWLGIAMFLLLTLFLTQLIYPSYSISPLKGTFLQLSSKIAFFFSILLLSISLRKSSKNVGKGIYWICLFFTIVQSTFGILQFLTNSTIFPLEIGGQKVSNTLFYYQGSSGSNQQILASGGHIRAIGLTNSSLTLGMFMLLGIVLVMSMKSKILKAILFLMFTVTIAMTLTRIIWIVWFILMTFLFLPVFKDSFQLQKLVSNIFWGVQIIFAFIPSILTLFQGIPFFDTLLSRFQGYTLFFQQFPITFKNIWIGQNFEMRILDYNTFGFSLDNQFLVVIMNLGLLFFMTYFLVNQVIVNKLIKNGKTYLAKLLLVLPMIGIVNDPSYFVFGILAIGDMMLMTELGEKKDFGES